MTSVFVLNCILSHLFFESETASRKHQWFAMKFAKKPANNQRDQNGRPREHVHGVRTNHARDTKTSVSALKGHTSIGDFCEFRSMGSVCLCWCGGVSRLLNGKYWWRNEISHIKVTNHKHPSTEWRLKTELIHTNLILSPFQLIHRMLEIHLNPGEQQTF